MLAARLFAMELTHQLGYDWCLMKENVTERRTEEEKEEGREGVWRIHSKTAHAAIEGHPAPQAGINGFIPIKSCGRAR
eukprot:5224264-Prorocentrum_lima.AAC.1